jgi:hypothetical protein
VCRQQEPRLCIERGRERENRQRSIDRSIDVCLSVCLCDVEHIYIYICETTTTNKREYIGVCCWLGWLGWLGVWGTGHRRPPPSQTKRAKPSQATHTKWNSTLCHIHCVCVQRTNNGGMVSNRWVRSRGLTYRPTACRGALGVRPFGVRIPVDGVWSSKNVPDRQERKGRRRLVDDSS